MFRQGQRFKDGTQIDDEIFGSIGGFFQAKVRFEKRIKLVGAGRFELPTSCTRSKRASQTTLRPDVREANDATPD